MNGHEEEVIHNLKPDNNYTDEHGENAINSILMLFCIVIILSGSILGLLIMIGN